MTNTKLTNLILIAVSAIIFYYLLLPAYNGKGNNYLGIKSFTSEYYKSKSLKDYLANARDISTATNQEFQAFNNITEDHLSKIDKSAPNKKELVRNINDIYSLGVKNKVDISSFRFIKAVGPTGGDNKKVHEISFLAKGRHYDFLNFLKEFENSLEMYNIKNLNITKSESLDGEKKPSDEINYTITTETYEING